MTLAAIYAAKAAAGVTCAIHSQLLCFVDRSAFLLVLLTNNTLSPNGKTRRPLLHFSVRLVDNAGLSIRSASPSIAFTLPSPHQRPPPASVCSALSRTAPKACAHEQPARDAAGLRRDASPGPAPACPRACLDGLHND